MADIKTKPQKLTELNPKWGGVSSDPDRSGMFLIFDCPCGVNGCIYGRTSIKLSNPLDGGEAWAGGRPSWQRTGEDFATLTLHPSLHMVGHWHGWVKNGMVISC